MVPGPEWYGVCQVFLFAVLSMSSPREEWPMEEKEKGKNVKMSLENISAKITKRVEDIKLEFVVCSCPEDIFKHGGL